jgi:hypothetical protein
MYTPVTLIQFGVSLEVKDFSRHQEDMAENGALLGAAKGVLMAPKWLCTNGKWSIQ